MKLCSKCGQWKELTEFGIRKNNKGGLQGKCKSCIVEKNFRWKSEHPVEYYCSMMLAQAKRRAAQFNRDFDLTLEDVKDLVVYTCPVLGVELRWKYGHGQSRDNSPSLDRIDNTKGYVKGNVAIISARANTLKNSLTKEEVKAVASYVVNPKKHLRRPRRESSKPARKQTKITPEMKSQIWALHLDGVPYREIAKILGVSKSSVGYVVNRLRFS